MLIPRNGTADYVRLPPSMPENISTQMRTKDFWQDLWTLSIAISVLLNFPNKLSESEQNFALNEIERATLPSEIARELSDAITNRQSSQRFPSEVLGFFLQNTLKSIQKARKGLQTVTKLFNQHITSGCAVFIDSFDQAISTVFPNDLDIWCSGQAGLLKAAWELSRHNRHVKIFATIRQEAFASFKDTEINNISGSILLIEYSKDDLRDIFTKAILHYEQVNSIEEFIGFNEIYNSFLNIREPIFDYICRHTTSVPRQFMQLGGKISNSRIARGLIEDTDKIAQYQKRISGIINEESSKLVFSYLTSEMSRFFGIETPERYIDGILKKIGSTVLSLANLKRICEKFIDQNGLGMNPPWQGTQHPFCLLYNFGLLGYVAKTHDETGYEQKFKKPYEFSWPYEKGLPDDPSAYYLIHPAVHHLIQVKNFNFKFKFNHVRIGDGLPWGEKETAQVQSEMIRIFISYSRKNEDIVKNIVNIIEQYLSEKSQIHDIWFDTAKMRAGRWFQDQMSEGLSSSEYLIFMVSKESLKSNAVSVEWKTKFADKLSKGKDVVFPFILDDTPYNELPDYLQHIHSYRYENSKDKIIRFVEDIISWKDEKNGNGHPLKP